MDKNLEENDDMIYNYDSYVASQSNSSSNQIESSSLSGKAKL